MAAAVPPAGRNEAARAVTPQYTSRVVLTAVSAFRFWRGPGSATCRVARVVMPATVHESRERGRHA
ncbi:hypothetical protein CT154_15850 [Komagataeibacter xylinus]|nr:hypothetical protein CT154_15850 [Komagataeibacter xylinus]